MRSLGGQLARAVKLDPGESTALVTTPEDADFLTAGFLEQSPSNTHLVCYWTDRSDTADVATVIQRFEEPMPRKIDVVVVLKSIISSGCIVRTNLEAFLTSARPARIVIAAPVMLSSAEKALRSQFSKSIAQRFEFVTFARDTALEGKIIRPGVGGVVEERLGLKGKSPRFLPELINVRRSAANAA